MKKILNIIKPLMQGAILTIVVLEIIRLFGSIVILLSNKCSVLLIFALIILSIVIVGKMLGME